MRQTRTHLRSRCCLTLALLTAGAANASNLSAQGGRSTAPALRAVEDLRIGASAPKALRFDIVDAVQPVADGFAVLARDMAASELRLFDHRGALRWTQVFTEDRPTGLATSGDTVAVLRGDNRNPGPVVLFRSAAPVPIAAIDVPSARGSSTLLVATSAGPFVVLVHRWAASDAGPLQPLPAQSYAFATVLSSQRLSPVFLSREDSTRRPILGSWAGQPSGIPKPMFTVAPGRFYYAASGSAVIEVHALNAGAKGPRTIDARALLSEGRQGASADSAFIGAMFARSDGTLAVVRRVRARGPVSDQPSLVQVGFFAPDGRYRGAVLLPAGTMVHAFAGSHLYTVLRTPANGAAGTPPEGASPFLIIRYAIEHLP